MNRKLYVAPPNDHQQGDPPWHQRRERVDPHWIVTRGVADS
jgi:hypothetical protein